MYALSDNSIQRNEHPRPGHAGEDQAERADVYSRLLDRTFIGMLERGQRRPTLESLFRIAAALKVAADLNRENSGRA
jgi:transcriptional regulator with XRE-family HTH domain